MARFDLATDAWTEVVSVASTKPQEVGASLGRARIALGTPSALTKEIPLDTGQSLYVPAGTSVSARPAGSRTIISIGDAAAVATAAPLLAVLKQGTDLYVRQPQHNEPAKDSMRRILFGAVQSATVAGPLDFVEQRMVDKATPDLATAWAAGDSVWASNDNGAPTKYQNTYLGGTGHGPPCYNLLSTAHGLTNTSVGDVGTISAKNWVLIKIVDANTLQVMAANTGPSVTNWTITGTPAANSTINFTVAGAKNYTTVTATQALPFAQNLTQQLLVDGAAVTTDGTYKGSTVSITQAYGEPNVAQWLLDLQAARGTSTPKWVNDPANQTQIQIGPHTWAFDKYGSLVGSAPGDYATQAFTLAGSGSYDYFGYWQHQALAKASHALFQYIPDQAAAVSGFDFTAIADISANAASVQVLRSNAVDPTNPPGRFAQILRLSGVSKYGLAMGYIAQRMTLNQNNWQWQMSNAEKQYPNGLDYLRFPNVGGFRTVAAGTTLPAAYWWDHGYLMTDRQSLTVDALYEDPVDGLPYRVVDVHATVDHGMLSMPAALVGRSVEIVKKHANFTLHSATVQAGGPTGGQIEYSNTTYGHAVVRVTNV